MTVNFYDLFPPDQILGDHYYRVSNYQFMFEAFGLEFHSQYVEQIGIAIYIGTKVDT